MAKNSERRNGGLAWRPETQKPAAVGHGFTE
jgi:hypothetical protein